MDPSPNHRSAQIYLDVRGVQTAFLSIPESDIERLSTRPFKWIRFVCFSICGAQGDLSATPNGPPLNYESPLLLLNHDKYYYTPHAGFELVYVDPKGLSARRTSSEASTGGRRPHFRQDVAQQAGGRCVFTGDAAAVCQAAHLIPYMKGDAYIESVIRNRTRCYDDTQQPQPFVSDINATENGMFLSAFLHMKLSCGDVAFLKTPNFAMDPTDIPRIERGPPCESYITLHQFKKHPQYDSNANRFLFDRAANGRPLPLLACAAGLNVDALFSSDISPEDRHLPPAIILDFVYGVTAYNRWAIDSMKEEVEDYSQGHYLSTPALPPADSPDLGESSDQDDDGDDDDDPDYFPNKKAKREHWLKKGKVMADAMDKMNLAMMFLRGITPQDAARMQDEQMEEEEETTQEAGRSKVKEWVETIPGTTQLDSADLPVLHKFD